MSSAYTSAEISEKLSPEDRDIVSQVANTFKQFHMKHVATIGIRPAKAKSMDKSIGKGNKEKTGSVAIS